MKIITFLKKPFKFALVYSLVLACFFAFATLDTFVIPKELTAVGNETSKLQLSSTSSSVQDTVQLENTEVPINTAINTPTSSQETSPQAVTPVITDSSYKDENISITIETVREYDTNFYVADIQVSDASYLKTALAQNAYGRNIKATTSAIAGANNAIFAVNGDYYGFRDTGFVLKNGELYRDTSSGRDDLIIDASGNFSIANESSITAQSILDSGATQVLSFGPALVENSQIAVSANSEVGQSMNSNPRTAIGQVSPLHYIVIVSDGRTSTSSGLSLLQLAEQFTNRGCTIAYNLDGGGSSTMYFNGKIVNIPASGKSSKEREVSDIVYVG